MEGLGGNTDSSVHPSLSAFNYQRLHTSGIGLLAYLTPVKNPVTSIFFCICSYSLQIARTKFKKVLQETIPEVAICILNSIQYKVDFIPSLHAISENAQDNGTW